LAARHCLATQGSSFGAFKWIHGSFSRIGTTVKKGHPMKLDTMMWLLLVFFMFHEFEEIIMMKPWVAKNKRGLRKRFPAVASRLLPHFEKLSTSSIALAIAVEFLLFSVLIFSAVELQLYALWTSILLVFFFHVIFHIFSFVLYRKYVPVIITSLLSIPYCLYALYFLKNNELFWSNFTRGFLIVVALGATVFIFALWLAARFEKWLNKSFIGK
jgi:hypothetical protein